MTSLKNWLTLIILLDLSTRTLFTLLSTVNLILFFFGLVSSIFCLVSLVYLVPYLLEQVIKKQMRLNRDLMKDWAWFKESVDREGMLDELMVKVVFERVEKVSLFGFERGRLINNGVLIVEGKDNDNKRIFQIGGSDVKLVKTKEGGTWRTRNYLRIRNEGDVFYGRNEIFVYAATGRDLESWYHALTRAGERNVEDDYSGAYQALLNRLNPYHTEHPVSSDWIIGIAHTIFYQYHKDPGLLKKLAQEIQLKLDKLNVPRSIIKTVLLKDISLGPQIPLLKSVEIQNVTSTGNLNLQADASYDGLFYLELEAIISLNLGFTVKRFPVNVYISLTSLKCMLNFFWARYPADRFWIGFEEFPFVDLDIKIQIKNKYRTFNLPFVSNIIRKLIDLEIAEKMVSPNMDDAAIPTIGKNKKEKKLKIHWEYDPNVTNSKRYSRDSFSHEIESSESDVATEGRDIEQIAREDKDIAEEIEKSLRDSMKYFINEADTKFEFSDMNEDIFSEDVKLKRKPKLEEISIDENIPPVPEGEKLINSETKEIETRNIEKKTEKTKSEEINQVVPKITPPKRLPKEENQAPPLPPKNPTKATSPGTELVTNNNEEEAKSKGPPLPPKNSLAGSQEISPPLPPKNDLVSSHSTSAPPPLPPKNILAGSQEISPPLPARPSDSTPQVISNTEHPPPLPNRTNQTLKKNETSLLKKIINKEKDKSEKDDFDVMSIFKDEEVVGFFKNRLKKRFQDTEKHNQ